MAAICSEPQGYGRAGYAQFQQGEDQHQRYETLEGVMPQIRSSRSAQRRQKGRQETKL